jgi:hypothetical protein
MTLSHREDGLASLVIVSVLVVLLALITLSFSRIMDRAVTDSLNNQLSAAASYAAQSAVNDAIAYIKGQADPGDVSSNDCTTLLKEPGLSNLVDLSGDGNTKITCLMVNPKPTDLLYQQLPPNGSQIVKATASDAVDKIMVSWQSPDRTKNAFPSSLAFSDVPTWSNNNYAPVLRIGLYPVPPSNKITGTQSASKTFFLVPGNGGGTVSTVPYTTADGSTIQANCNTKTISPGSFDSSSTASYDCNVIINGLYAAIEPDGYYYLTLTPIYGQADVKVKADNASPTPQPVQFEQVQTVIDATAKSNNAAKRLQERVDSDTAGDNISASAAAAPAFSVRSANALCKQLEVHNSYYNYILNDAPGTCSSGGGSPKVIPPTLAFSIVGGDGRDAGLRMCSTGKAPNDQVEYDLWGCTGTANPDTPQNPVENSTVYINSSATVYWQDTDSALSCNASDGWSGDKNPVSSWNHVTGTGSQGFGGIGDVTSYSLQCNGPGGTTAKKTVTAWPPPVITNFSGPTTNHAGDSYYINWNSKNDVRCDASGDWTASNVGTSGSHRVDTSWDDHSTKHFYLTCYDPIGRSTGAVALNGGANGGGVTQISPECNAVVTPYGNNTSYGGFGQLYASCPAADAAGGTHAHLTSNTSLGSGYISPPAPYTNSWYTSTPGTYCAQISVWVDGWTSESGPSVNTNNVCVTVKFIIKITFFDAQGPYNNPNVDQRFCPDGDHHWMDCVRWATQSSDSSQVSCQVVFHGPNGSSSSSGWLPANWGTSFGSNYKPYVEDATFDITCRGPGGAQATDSRGLCYKYGDYASGCSDANR